MDGSDGVEVNREFIVEHSSADDVFPRGEIGKVGSRGREAALDVDMVVRAERVSRRASV